MMATLKHQKILLSQLDDIIELKFTPEEYLRILNYSSDSMSKHLNSPENRPRTNDEKIQMAAIRDSLSAIMNKQGEAISSKILILQNNQ